ncbi:hypothetical protein ACIBJI_40125 [Nocardia sp. NPDC050408]|uniref:hypothetical protein n=1 Tax=Nocardia sp. NPDC050408 TaxID=3364319 RepID=UPI0037ABFC46
MCTGLAAGFGFFAYQLWPLVPTSVAHRVLEVAVPVAIGVVCVLAALVLMAAAVASAFGRGWRYRRYRRRWVKALDKVGLVTEKRGELVVPRLRSVSVHDDGGEVLRVRMLEGQSPKDWDNRAARLARAFGAASGRISWDPDHMDEVRLVLTRRRSPKFAPKVRFQVKGAA